MALILCERYIHPYFNESEFNCQYITNLSDEKNIIFMKIDDCHFMKIDDCHEIKFYIVYILLIQNFTSHIMDL